MTMQMKRAFNPRMLTKVQCYEIEEGSYDIDNIWVEGTITEKNIQGVLKSGNRFSQFEEGEAIHNEDGGARFSRFKTLHVIKKYSVAENNKIGFEGNYYNVLQRSNELVYGFMSLLLEKAEEWTP